jgi:RHH-type proline utilization regulon transcriptional repressor/proline dehydrogenase/delta 1-pyrroline-5-carboxylate dehydrogenase
VIEAVARDPGLAGWDGFGVVVQAYSRRAGAVIDWLAALAGSLDRRFMVRLVKGAYWDTEIKRAQVEGLEDFPVFTRKSATDVSYLACARKLFDASSRLYPQFATHNAHTMAAILQMAGNRTDGFEFQRLHGMGEALHEMVRRDHGTACRIYAPVGRHRDLLAYLVRRLLENGGEFLLRQPGARHLCPGGDGGRRSVFRRHARSAASACRPTGGPVPSRARELQGHRPA